MRREGLLVRGMEEYKRGMEDNEINTDIQSLEEMLPVEEGCLERQIFNADSGSEMILDFTERQSRYWLAWGDLQKLKEIREVRRAERKRKGR